jgi:hypothetical protein
MYDYGSPMGFEEGDFDTSLTQVLQSNEGLETLTPFNSGLDTDINTGEEWEYAGQFPSMWIPEIQEAPTGDANGKATRFRRVSGSTESLIDLALVEGSIPRIPDSVPSLY